MTRLLALAMLSLPATILVGCDEMEDQVRTAPAEAPEVSTDPTVPVFDQGINPNDFSSNYNGAPTGEDCMSDLEYIALALPVGSGADTDVALWVVFEDGSELAMNHGWVEIPSYKFMEILGIEDHNGNAIPADQLLEELQAWTVPKRDESVHLTVLPIDDNFVELACP